MRKMTFDIVPGETKTVEKYFTHYDHYLVIKAINSRITGLILRIGDANGRGKGIPLTNTSREIKEIVKNLGYCWFEWKSTDQFYKIEVELHG